MARLNNEFSLAWASLSGSATELGWRTIPITPAGRCSLSAGRRFPGNHEALLVGFASASIPTAEKLPEGQGFSVERVNLPDDVRTWFALTRKENGSIELFMAMVCDAVEILNAESSSDDPRLLRVFLGRVRAWQEFMRKGAQALSPEAEIGLIGELKLLSLVIESGMPSALALEAWVGPLDGIQDFEIGTGAIEVKATLSVVGFPARIGSLEQLDDSVRQPLFLAGIRLLQISSGKNLTDFVSDLRQSIAGNAEAERLFSERLIAVGFFAAHADRYPRRFEVSSARVVEVTEGFPKLTIGRVPLGISKAMYEIDFDRVPGVNIGTGEALKKLGVL
jgi:hypothetical protein